MTSLVNFLVRRWLYAMEGVSLWTRIGQYWFLSSESLFHPYLVHISSDAAVADNKTKVQLQTVQSINPDAYQYESHYLHSQFHIEHRSPDQLPNFQSICQLL